MKQGYSPITWQYIVLRLCQGLLKTERKICGDGRVESSPFFFSYCSSVVYEGKDIRMEGEERSKVNHTIG